MLYISAAQVHKVMDWQSLIKAMHKAHQENARPEIADSLLKRGNKSLLVRSSIFSGVGIGLKAVTVFPDNSSHSVPKPTIQGEFLLFDEDDGSVLAIIDGSAITPWKTAADSALGASLLARTDAKILAMIGAGVMAQPLIEAHLTARPSIECILLWNRTKVNSERLAGQIKEHGRRVQVVDQLEEAICAADLISSATFSVAPLIRGEWLKPGVHIDLIGAFRPDMREADDDAMRRGRIFVDSYETTIEHIGEISIPLREKVIERSDIEGDLFDLCSGSIFTRTEEDITIYKNGGGAHLDLITAKHIFRQVSADC